MAKEREEQHLTVLPVEDDQDVEFSGSAKEAKRRSQEDIGLIELAGEGQGAGDSSSEESGILLQMELGNFKTVQESVTTESLINAGKNPLLFAIKVAERLHNRAAEKEFDCADFTGLANQVEEFILRFLDPLINEEYYRRKFINDPQTGVILETAVKLEQKKFFDHPIIVELMTERWLGARHHLESSKIWWLLLNIWCLFDIVLFPVIFLLTFVLEWISKRVGRRLECVNHLLDRAKPTFQKYKGNFTIPYFVFIRDMLSYLALLGLHFAICVQPSQLKFSNLEWAILIFLFGRLLMEIKQFNEIVWRQAEEVEMKLNALRSYARDRWNLFDLAIVIIYFVAIFPLRIVTWAVSESIPNNRALEVAGYFYGFNTMLLTFRAFGSILETIEGVGTVQIAFFNIIRDAVLVVIHFVAITLAFSSSITKIFVVETSKVNEEPGKYTWWRIASQLGLSLLDLSDGLDFFKLADSVSQTIVHVLYAVYLVMALILLVNLLIALLSNTYQQVQDNSKKEWEFRRAVTILTYCNYHPIPVPLNIISTLAAAVPGLIKKKVHGKDDADAKTFLKRKKALRYLAQEYKKNYGDSFPPISTDKLDHVLDDSVNTRRMVNHVLCSTFKTHQASDKAFLPVGPKAWDTHNSIIVDGYLLTSTSGPLGLCGARYRTAFSPDFPHFEVMTLDPSPKKSLAIGVAFKNYSRDIQLGKDESVAYWTVRGIISDKGTDKNTTGYHKAGQGDLIRCTIMFEEKQEIDGNLQVPVVFTINGSRIIYEGDSPLMEYCPDRPLYPYISFGYTTSVLAKMVMREEVDHQDLQLQQTKSKLTKTLSELNEAKTELRVVKTQLTEIKSKLFEANKNLEKKFESKLAKVNESLEIKLDTVLAKLSEK